MKNFSKFLLFGLVIVAAAYLMYAGTENKTKVQQTTQQRVRVLSQTQATFGNGYGFIDEDGDGINDYARDDDGDGIPNGLDPDYVKPMDGTGRKLAYGRNGERGHRGAGSGLCTDCGEFNHNYGGNNGTGVCDGNGPHGNAGRNRGQGKH